jgi:hypothetical protein
LHDAVTAELAGTPAVAVITDRFTATADLMAEMLGLPGYRYAVVAHPFASDTREQLQRKAEEAVRQACDLLTQRPAAAR